MKGLFKVRVNSVTLTYQALKGHRAVAFLG